MRVLVVLIFSALLFAVPAAHAQVVGTAALVNGVEISVFRLERHFEDYLKSQGRNVGAIRNPAVFKRLKREALEQLIDVELLWQEAQRRGIAADEADVTAQMARAEAGFRNREAWLARLSESGFDEAGYRAYVRRELAARRVYIDMGQAAEPSATEVQAFYEANRARFVRPVGAPNGGASPQALPEADAMRQARALLIRQRGETTRQAGLDALRRAATIERRIALD